MAAEHREDLEGHTAKLALMANPSEYLRIKINAIRLMAHRNIVYKKK